MFKSIRRRVPHAAAAATCGLLLLAALCWINIPAKGASTSCGSRVVHDYGMLIRNLQSKYRRLPEDNGLPGASAIGVFPLDRDQVLLSGERVGYRLEVLRRENRTEVRRGLRLQARLFRLKAHGQHLIARQDRLVTLRKDGAIEFGKAVSTGIYRLDVQVATSEMSLGSYKEFFRVLPRRVDIRLAMNGVLFREGEAVVGRLENHGTVDALLPKGSALVLERQVDSGWEEIPTGRPGAMQIADPEFLYRGRATGCTSFRVLPATPPGTYRVTVVADPFGARFKSRPIRQQLQIAP